MSITFHPDGRITGNSANNFGAIGNVINVTHGQHATTGMSTQSTTFVR